MALIDNLFELRKVNFPAIKTNDAAGIWKITTKKASVILGRLAKSGHIRHFGRNLWILDEKANPMALHSYLTDPSSSYISLQTALFYHGMIEQIPETIHIVSTAKSNSYENGKYIVHQVSPYFFAFSGYEAIEGGLIYMATPEKALVDFFYFKMAKTRMFRFLPEVELPENFDKNQAKNYINLIKSVPRKIVVEEAMRKFLD